MKTYFKIPMSLVSDSTISSGAKLLYGLLSGLCNQKGYCWATNAFLGKRLSISPRSISRYLAELRKAGLVEYHHVIDEEESWAKRQIYVLDWEKRRPAQDRNTSKDSDNWLITGTVDEETPDGHSGEDMEAAAMESRSEREELPPQPEENFSKPMAQVVDWMESLYPQWTQEDKDYFAIIMKEFLLHRKRLGCPMGAGRALASLCDRLTDLAGDDSMAMVELLTWAISNGWKNVFPLKQRQEWTQEGR